MIIIVTASFIAIVLAILDSAYELDYGTAIGMALMTILAAIRYDVGSDYLSYMDDFNLVSSYSYSDLLFMQENLQNINPVFKDIGTSLMYRTFAPVGFFGFVALISFLQGWIYYNFIVENVDREYYWFAMAIYLFQFEFFVLPMSMIRQGLVIALMVWAWHFVCNKNYWMPVILSAFSFSIHKSSLIFIPFLFLYFVPMRKGKVVVITFVSLAIVMFGAAQLMGVILEGIMGGELFMAYNASYADEGGGEIGMARILIAFIPFVLAMLYLWDEDTMDGPRNMVALSVIGTLLLPFSFIIQMITRLGYYFNIFMVAVIPITIWQIRDQILRYGIMAVMLLLLLYEYYNLFTSSIWTEKFMNYQTIFSTML